MTDDATHTVELEDDLDESDMSKGKKSSTKLQTTFNVPATEEVIKKFRCSLNLKMPHNGTMYITSNYILFHSSIPSKELRRIPLKDINTLEKKKTMKVVPNAIRVTTNAGNEYLFGSFIHRDEAYNTIETQKREAEELIRRKEQEARQKSAQVGDMFVKNYRVADKIIASEIIDDLSGKKDDKKGCRCTIL